MSFHIVKCGTKIITICGEMKGIVTGVSIRDESVSYEMSYFSNGTHNTCWLYRYEFKIDIQFKKQAGFNRPQDLKNDNNIMYLENNWRCGQGENRCNCKAPEDCGYVAMAKQIGKLSPPKQD